MGKIELRTENPSQGEIVIYQPDEVTRLEVKVEGETVWLTQDQIAILFGVKRPAITKHIRNIFLSEELEESSVCSILERTAADDKIYMTRFYNLDMILSVGYRVNSKNAIHFRRWASVVLKEYMLKGFAINQRLHQIEDRFDRRMTVYERLLDEHEKKIDFFIRTSLPPVEGVFYDGQIFDAYVFATDLVRSATKSLILIDNYVDESVLLMLSKRQDGVSAEIRTGRLTDALKQDIEKHNSQYLPITMSEIKNIHDRFLIVDEDVYHIGASFKDLGKKLFAFSKMNISKDLLL